MTKSDSEAYLLSLASRTFLKLWAIPNTYYKAGKELTDLIVPFGDDIIVISDKASRFDFETDPEIAWRRWYAKTVEEGMRQLKTAMQRVQRDPGTVFMDGRATAPIPHQLGPIAGKRFHLVSIVRPDKDPANVPSGWPGLRTVAPVMDAPFTIGPLSVGDTLVHVFDGPAIDLLLEQLDTVADFLAYLKGRERRLKASQDHDFEEQNLLAAALIGWEEEPPGLPSVPPIETIVPGLWDLYSEGETPARRVAANRRSRAIDQLIAIHDGEYSAGRALYGAPTFSQHEHAMRLLAAESRFARRIIAHELYDILEEPDQSTYWVSTIASPTTPELRYVWLIRPDYPEEIPIEQADLSLQTLLKQHVYVVQGRFEQTLVLGIALPNRQAEDTMISIVLHNGSNWTDADREEARKLGEEIGFDRLEENHRAHFR